MRYKLYALYMLLGLALVQYQNCAPSSETLNNPSVVDSGAIDGSVDVIDSINVGEISFAQNKVSAFLDQSVEVLGVCGQSGSLIGWTLKDASGELIERGLSECHLGSFKVSLGDQWQSFCDQDLTLKAALGTDAISVTTVEAFCD